MSDAPCLTATLHIDPATLSTAQQKVMNFHAKRIITNPRVAKAMRTVRSAATIYAKKAEEVAKATPSKEFSLSVRFLFAYPKSLTKRQREEMYEGKPVTSARYGDLDNRGKAFVDALALAKWFPDDRFITTLTLTKRYTLRNPRIEVTFKPDKEVQNERG